MNYAVSFLRILVKFGVLKRSFYCNDNENICIYLLQSKDAAKDLGSEQLDEVYSIYIYEVYSTYILDEIYSRAVLFQHKMVSPGIGIPIIRSILPL